MCQICARSTPPFGIFLHSSAVVTVAERSIDVDTEKGENLKNKQAEQQSSGIEKNSIAIYRTKDGKTEIEVKLKEETVWLSQIKMARLFDKVVPTINEHIKNIYKEKELEQKSTIRKFRIVQTEGGRRVERPIDFYNLDVIISVGYRVKSLRGTQFRIWATKTLKDYLIQGYAVNQKRLSEQSVKLKELQDTIKFIKTKSSHPELSDQTQELLNIINEYANSLTLLYQYDKGTLKEIRGKKPEFILTYKDSQKLIV